jgi:hypothetical protein
MAVSLCPGVLLSKLVVYSDIHLEERPFHTLKTHINKPHSSLFPSVHGICLRRALHVQCRIIVNFKEGKTVIFSDFLSVGRLTSDSIKLLSQTEFQSYKAKMCRDIRW